MDRFDIFEVAKAGFLAPIQTQLQRNDPVKIDSDGLLELSGFDHKALGVVLAINCDC